MAPLSDIPAVVPKSLPLSPSNKASSSQNYQSNPRNISIKASYIYQDIALCPHPVHDPDIKDSSAGRRARTAVVRAALVHGEADAALDPSDLVACLLPCEGGFRGEVLYMMMVIVIIFHD